MTVSLSGTEIGWDVLDPGDLLALAEKLASQPKKPVERILLATHWLRCQKNKEGKYVCTCIAHRDSCKGKTLSEESIGTFNRVIINVLPSIANVGGSIETGLITVFPRYGNKMTIEDDGKSTLFCS